MTQWLMSRNSFWTRTNIILLAIGLEHVIIGLKVVIALLIPDVPKAVKLAEEKRKGYLINAKQAIADVKRQKNAKDIDEIVESKL